MSSTILVVDDSAVIRGNIRSLIERNTDWVVCGEAENGEVALKMVVLLGPFLRTAPGRPSLILVGLTDRALSQPSVEAQGTVFGVGIGH